MSKCRISVLGVLSVAIFAGGCHTDMWVQPKYKPMQESSLFPDNTSSRELPEGTVAVGQLREEPGFFTGRQNNRLVRQIPMDMTMRMLNAQNEREVIEYGRERFDAFCSPCHGRVGDGRGMIAQRGLDLKRRPANYHTPRLRNMPDGHYFDVITNGFGIMFPYASRIEPAERWAIVAYIRALQYSQNRPEGAIPAEEMEKLRQPATTTTAEPRSAGDTHE